MYAELEQTKTCLQCKNTKSLRLFRRRIKEGKYVVYESYCKNCERANDHERYFERGGKQVQKAKDFVRNCKKFGLTEDDYLKMAISQNFKCAICDKPETATRCGVVKNLAIDHCHTTGKVRALLCHSCNAAIGSFKENVDILESAVRYLKKFKN
jgi:hypothetical protein